MNLFPFVGKQAPLLEMDKLEVASEFNEPKKVVGRDQEDSKKDAEGETDMEVSMEQRVPSIRAEGPVIEVLDSEVKGKDSVRKVKGKGKEKEVKVGEEVREREALRWSNQDNAEEKVQRGWALLEYGVEVLDHGGLAENLRELMLRLEGMVALASKEMLKCVTSKARFEEAKKIRKGLEIDFHKEVELMDSIVDILKKVEKKEILYKKYSRYLFIYLFIFLLYIRKEIFYFIQICYSRVKKLE